MIMLPLFCIGNNTQPKGADSITSPQTIHIAYMPSSKHSDDIPIPKIQVKAANAVPRHVPTHIIRRSPKVPRRLGRALSIPAKATAQSRLPPTPSPRRLLIKLERQRRQKARHAPPLPHPKLDIIPYPIRKCAARAPTDLHRALFAIKDDTIFVLVCRRRIVDALDAHLAAWDEGDGPPERAEDGLLELG